MSIQNSIPFSMKWAQNKGTAGGMNTQKAFTEIIDNDIDSQRGKVGGYSFGKSMIDIESGTVYFLLWGGGDGLTDLPHVFGLGDSTPKKSSSMIGNFNHGHTATVAYFNPSAYHALSKTALTNSRVLAFRTKEFDTAVNDLGTDDSATHCYRQVNVNDYMTVSDDCSEIFDCLNEIAQKIRDPLVKADLLSICKNEKASYFLNLLTFNHDHPMAAEFSIDEDIEGFFPSVSLHYGEFLKNGYRIVFERSATCPRKKQMVADGSTVINPIVCVKEFPKISFVCEMYNGEQENETYLDVFMDCAGHERRFYVTDRPVNKKLKTPEILTEAKSNWIGFKNLGAFTFDINCPSEVEFQKFSRSLGTDLNNVDNTRGVYTRFQGRNLGKPFWGKEFGAARNSGYVSAVLDTDSKVVATKLGLQSNKHNSDLNEAHPVIRKFVNTVMKSIIDRYTNYNNKETTKEGIRVWKIDEAFELFTGVKKKVVRAKKAETPKVTGEVKNVLRNEADASESKDINIVSMFIQGNTDTLVNDRASDSSSVTESIRSEERLEKEQGQEQGQEQEQEHGQEQGQVQAQELVQEEEQEKEQESHIQTETETPAQVSRAASPAPIPVPVPAPVAVQPLPPSELVVRFLVPLHMQDEFGKELKNLCSKFETIYIAV